MKLSILITEELWKIFIIKFITLISCGDKISIDPTKPIYEAYPRDPTKIYLLIWYFHSQITSFWVSNNLLILHLILFPNFKFSQF